MNGIMQRFMLFALTLCSLASYRSLGEDSQDWPGLMGPKRNGWVGHFSPPAEWPNSLKPTWKADVGAGYGSPIVNGDRVYQHARQGDEEVIWCLDLKTGEVKWRKSHEVYFKMGEGAQRHGKGPKSCPVFADGRVFTFSITGILSAWNAADGKLLWREDFKNRFKKNQPYWGVSTSPIVDENRVIVHIGDDEKGSLVALDVKTGKGVWSQGNDGTSYSSPLVVEIAGVRQIVMWNHEALVGVESKTGDLLWRYPFPHVSNNQNMPTPVLHKGHIIVGGENRGIRSVKPTLLDGKWSAKEIWKQEEVALDMCTAVVNGEFLFGLSHYRSGQFFCLDPNTGEVLWKGPGRTGPNVAFLSIPGHIVALINDGELRIIKATGKSYQPVQSYRVAEDETFATWAPPVLLNDGVLIKDKNTLALWSWGAPATK
jgi:outer membrane protein assembly factor BamB